MNRIREWYNRNNVSITWFLIGFLVMSGLVEFGRGNYFNGFISFVIAYVNYALRRS